MALQNFNVAVLASEALEAYRPIVAPLAAFSLKAEPQGNVGLGDTVKVPIVGKASTASAFDASTNNYATDNSTSDDVAPVVINGHAKSGFSYTPDELKKVTAQMYKAKLETHMAAVMAKVTTDVLAVASYANFGVAPKVLPAASWDFEEVVDVESLWKTNNGQPIKALNLVLSSAGVAALKVDDAVSNLSASGYTIVQDGIVRPINGINIFETSFLRTNVTGILTDGSGIAVATSVFGLPQGAIEAFVVTDPLTGIEFLITVDYIQATHSIMTTVEALYGAAKARAAGLLRVTSIQET